MKDEVDLVIDGKLLDFSRFMSWVGYGTTAESARFDPFNMTLLAGTYYLNILHQHGFDVRVENVVDRCTLASLGKVYAPRFILISTTLMFDAGDREVLPAFVRQIRTTWPEAIIVLGGLMLVSYEKNYPPAIFAQLLRTYGADIFVVSPQGEAPLVQILAARSLEGIISGPGIAKTYVRVGDTILPPRTDQEHGPTLDDSYIRWDALPQTDHLYHTVHMRTARSCAFQCAFCEYPINQGPLTLASIETIEKELESLKQLNKVRSIVFTDDTFNVPLRRFKEVLKLLSKYDFEWYSFFRPQYADQDTARMMKEAGCRAVFAGLESVDDTLLKNMRKVAHADDYKRGIEQLKRQDIHVHANFIIGFPGETEQSAEKIVPFIDSTGIEFHTVCTWAFIPSTPIGSRRAEFGIEGFGVDWHHNTMDAKTAQSLARNIAPEPRHSVHNAVRGEAWTEFLFYANGFTVSETQSAIAFFNRFLERDVPAEEIRTSADFVRLQDLLTTRQMPRPSLATALS
jgi:radical SAM superfamily enzyme YgiQ (UPF0313 family)